MNPLILFQDILPQMSFQEQLSAKLHSVECNESPPTIPQDQGNINNTLPIIEGGKQ